MNFSFCENRSELFIPSRENLDVFCFFQVPHSVSLPADLWFPSLCASLRLKREVLILEPEILQFPSWDATKRWVVGDQWIWLAPRSLSSLQQFYKENSATYELMKNRLIQSK